jgi:hypothetical protein
MTPGRARAAAAALLAAMAGMSTGHAGLVDCLADEVARFIGGYSPPEAGLRVAELPGIVAGPPGDSLPVAGSTSTVSLGRGGSITVAFTDNMIVDGPGPDFIVFENAFFRSFVPADPNQASSVFAEPGAVAVSQDGVTFVTFPYDADALDQVGTDSTPTSALPSLAGLAGITPTFTGNWTVPDDPLTWDPEGRGGVSGAGGDAFDLAVVGMASARFVRITDLGLPTGFAGAAEGFDLDAVVALNSIPWPEAPASLDQDGDGLPDDQETLWFGSDPFDPDTDGDGAPDGEEAARCRSPLSDAAVPATPVDPDLWWSPDGAWSAGWGVWSFVSSSATYDVVRGVVGAAGAGLPPAVVCVEDNSFNLTSSDHADPAAPAAGQSFFYLVRPKGHGYGKGTAGAARVFTSGDCPP